MRVKLSASIICADLADLASEVQKLEEAGVDMLHFDVMDGHFVRNLGLGPVIVEHLRKLTSLPFEAHLMMTNPERYLRRFVDAGSQIIAAHVETSADFRRLAREIRELGASPAVALNPDTPVEQIEPFLDDVCQVLIMTVEPGFVGQPLIKHALPRITEVRDAIRNRKLSVAIAVDGNVSFENAPGMASAGAGVLVCGTSSLFSREVSFSEAVRRLRESVCRSRQNSGSSQAW
jgi:ribulose-phosphate 3-epimerase